NRGSFAAALHRKTVALVALHIEGAKDLVFNVGEFSIKRGTYDTPAAPVVTNAKLLRAHYQGIDGKLFWDMASNKAAGEPVYNLDVKTSMFKLYAREEGGEPVFVGATSSWAGMFYSVPFSAENAKPVQLGVSAVSLDGNSESEIAWSQAMSHPTYDVINDITIDKNVIKPLEGFTIRYVDPMHTPSTWAIYNSSNQKMASATGTFITVKNGEGFAQTGGYDLVVDEGTDNEHRYGYYVQVSSEAVGAVPEIYTISVNGNEASASDESVKLELTEGTEATEPVFLSYTGRDADGAASRGLELRERFFGLNVGSLGITPGQSFSVAFWILYDEFPNKEWSLFDITNRGGAWPVSNWGYAWHRGNGDGQLFMTYRGSSGNGVSPGELNYTFNEGYGKVQAKTWTHIAFTVDYKDATHIRSHLYLNGVLQPATFQRAKGGGQGYFGATGTEQDYADTKWDISANDWLSLGGLPNGGLAINGILDDFQVWSKAMTAADVKTSMAGLDPANLPADVMCLWDFEDDAESDFGFLSKGAKPGIKAYSFDCVGGEDAQEGQGLQTPFVPFLNSGCPFISGTAYPIVTTPSWSTDKASSKKTVISDAQGNGEAGSAKVAFNAEGDYNINLTLANSYGKSTATYPVINVKAVSGLAEVAAEMVEVHTDANGIFVDFPAEGRYTVSVFDVQGRTVAQRADQVNAGQMMHVNITTPGAYIVRVNDAEGNMLRAVKVIKH
ncbi:MAG: T9SS type A sorting domain-containing protein, partial [Muribaculaceae bacterium]|nr:T9SS type A sorting domain-containing protein [Muribaculaceae bacterium]